MCYVLYLGSDVPLPIVPWSDENPQFHVSELEEKDEGVRSRFSKPYVYFVGSHTYCGCGFFYGPQWTYREDEKAELHQMKESVRTLVSYLSSALERTDELQLFACWDGDEGLQAVSRSELTPEELLGEEFPLDEKHFAVVRKNRPG